MPPRPGDEETIAPIVAKHAKRIRCLVVRSQWTFNACKHVCRQLTKLYFDMPSRGIPRSMSDADVLAFVECQSNLQSIYSPQFSATFKDSLLQLNREWLHFDVMLSDKDFSNIHLLLPHTRTARVELLDEGFDTEIFRLSRPHVNLRELVLRMDHFDHHMLKDILQSFPNLRRLTVEAKYGDPSCGTWRTIWLDLFLDNGYSMLVVEESPAWDIVRLIPLLPNLLVYEGYGCTFPIFDILAQYCPRLMHCRHEEMPDYSVPFVPVLHATNGQNFYAIQTSPEKSIVQVLASCRDLVSAYSFPWSISLADLTSAPWVCHKLKYLHCVFDEVPLLSDAEQEVYRSLLERRRERRAANQQYSQFDSEWMSEDERAVDRKAESLKTYIEAIEEQLQRVPDIDLKPHRIGDPIPGIDSFLGQMEAAKASIGL
ncbi:hypothetical protein BGZ73_003399 [Actinomortierella ambigua]|nr:hypothetical protein BGZ73_003399 [Actinomortierella ambigua]